MTLSRLYAAFAAMVLASCASPAATERVVLLPLGEAAPAIQVANIDDALDQFMGAGGNDLILLPNRLDRSQLDFSLDSLQAIDRWLADIHTINRLQSDKGRAGEGLVSDGRGDNSVIFAGLYLGQVIRANSDAVWSWQEFDIFLQANPVFAEHYGKDAGLDMFVLVGPQGVATPINTALKRVLFGEEESVFYIAHLLSKEIDLDKAMSGQDLLGMDRRDWPG